MLHRFDEADALLETALAKFSNYASGAIEYARISQRRGDWPGALRRWEAAHAAFPANAAVVVGLAVALQMLRRLDEADELLAAAKNQFPTHPGIATEYARVAVRRSDRAEELRRWQDAWEQMPGDPEIITGYGTALQKHERYAEAEEILADAVQRFPNHPALAVEYARIPHRRADWPEASDRWQRVVSSYPNNLDAMIGLVDTLKYQDRSAAWEEALARAIERFPSQSQFAFDYARAAQHRRDWPEAIRRWETAEQSFPQTPLVAQEIGKIKQQLDRDVGPFARRRAGSAKSARKRSSGIAPRAK
jgi:tetratricopeptide (TPR) repeat protein